MTGMMGRILLLDLTEKESEFIERPELFEKFLGGSGAAIKLLEEFCPARADPFSPDAPIVFAIGPLTVAFPCCSKVVSMFKSPITGNLGESHAGGRFGLAMRLAGYDAIIIKGRADFPTYIAIHDEEVSFKDASALWGISTYSTGRVLREIEGGGGRRSIIRIGPAGENRVRFANVNVDTYRHFGRLGLGAIFGSKLLKAIVISGTKSYSVKNPERYKEVYKDIYDKVTKAELMKKYHDLGTGENVMALNILNAFPTRNFTSAQFEKAHKISGEYFAENLLMRKMACSHCPLGCIHIALLRVQFADGYEYGSTMVPYDYEPIYALGSMLGIGIADHILQLVEKVDRYGLDAISTGVVLAWATEIFRMKLISERETMGVHPRWGDVNSYAKMIDLMISMPNKFYRSIARGLDIASDVYGGKEFAMTLGKNEVAGYHCGPATILGQLLGARHSHLDNAGYNVDLKGAPEETIVDELMKEEMWRNVLTSLVICLFARGVYTEEVVRGALLTVGIERSVEELRRLGEEIYKEKWRLKLREGFKFEGLRVPERFFKTATPQGVLKREVVEKLMKVYESRISSLLT